MRYCITGRQPKSTLEQADEIKMKYVDQGRMIEYIHDWPNKIFILEITKEIMVSDIEWTKWSSLVSENNNIIFALKRLDVDIVNTCKDLGINFYWDFPITSWYELQGVIALEPCYLFLGAPLCFDLMKVRMMTKIPFRLCPNLAFDSYIPRKDGVCGSWIRPEDVETYEEYVSTLEFVCMDMEHERTLLHVYKDNKSWPGNLNLLLTNLNVNVDNRAIPNEVGATRMNCGQRCMASGSCHFCDTAVRFANAIRDEHYRRLKEKTDKINEQIKKNKSNSIEVNPDATEG